MAPVDLTRIADGDDEDDDGDDAEPASKEVIRVVVRMQTDPERRAREETSARAIQQWEKRRNVTIFRVGFCIPIRLIISSTS